MDVSAARKRKETNMNTNKHFGALRGRLAYESHFMVEKVLLVFERLRATDVFQQEVGEGGRDYVALLRSQLDLGLAAVVDYEDRSVIVVDLDVGRRQKLELKVKFCFH